MLSFRPLAAMCLMPLSIASQTSAPDAVNDWVRASAIRLATPVAGHGFDDMQPLKKVVGDARIVALGEATHGTREFFQLKHRMLEFFATQMGFTIFSIEANMPEAYRLNDFVLNGQGDPAKLIKGMYFWTWDTEEVLDMVLWMRDFNKSGKGRVEFTGFDMQTPNVANQIVRDFVAKADPEYAPALARASELALAPALVPQAAFGTASGTFPPEPALGKTIRFSGYIKTENVSGYAGFWWRADARNQPAAFANLGDAAPKGTTDWHRYQLELSVPAKTNAIYFGPLLAGSGTAWFDDLQVEIDGQPYASDAYDFSFEGPTLKGLSPAIPTYPTRLDDRVAHSGKQSLRISHIATPENPKAVDPKTASAEWSKVLDHLEASRERYQKEKAATGDIEWAIQNARVVEQCIEMRAGQATRDASMAANVKWIVDRSPGAKMVLWAHNGHVAAAGSESMGAALRKMYGNQMVVFGFSFNQGSFQAISPNRGLRDFTVPPAPAGSLDATLAASGIPLFALDLRASPKTGPVAEWLHAGHSTRSIGALYPENSPYANMLDVVAPEAFDALLFVEKTTAARRNGGTADAASQAIEFKAIAPPAGDTGGVTEYRDPESGVSVKLPKGWKVGAASRFGDHETSARLIDGASDAGGLYFKMRPNAARSDEESYTRLLANPESKAAARVAAGLADYRIRPGSVERRTVGGRPALSCVGEFTRGDVKMAEYLTWVSGENAQALIFSEAAGSELGDLRQRLDPVIETLKLP
jgi:erythromycin esterase-like protein